VSFGVGYDFKAIEEKWQSRWQERPFFNTKNDSSKKKYYCLDMFPYPSASGLHVGHWKGYVFSDVYARQKLLEGYNVLHPMGWDAFGLPAENDAIKKGMHPKINTEKNIAVFKEQLKKIGAIYDWTKEVDTTDPDYYKWTQWIFLQMFKDGLAYEKNTPVNWCPKCLTGLANEEATGGACDRCGTEVEQKAIRQWVLKITHYADALVDDLDELDWPEKVKSMQKHWIGRSQGINIDFDCDGQKITVYTTRHDTLPGCKFLVISPDHDLVEIIVKNEHKDKALAYQKATAEMPDMQRVLDKNKTGVFTGAYATNPVNGEQVPVYLASYVLKDYGTGAVMAVPAHDQRDFEFAKKFTIPVVQVIRPCNAKAATSDALQEAYLGDGLMINSGQFDGLSSTDAKAAIANFLVDKKVAEKKTCYRLRDWIFSRQRYWGEPIPLIHCQKCGVVPVSEKELPVRLPDVEKYEPTGCGESPLAAIDHWVNTSCPECGGEGKRETNTMPQWAGSCWYFMRYPTPESNEVFADYKQLEHWLPVDLYVGGIEHAVLHLLYSRFYVKFLHEKGLVHHKEPFKKLFNKGIVCMKSEKTGRVEKMSKSKGNVVNPDDIVAEMGSDALRLYMLFMGPPEMDTEWQTASIKGVSSFLSKLWSFLTNKKNVLPGCQKAELAVSQRFHRFLSDFQFRLESYRVNTSVSAIMEFYNDLSAKNMQLDLEIIEQFLAVISIMVPHFSSELLLSLCGKELDQVGWPVVNPELAAVNNVQVPVQINGKLRAVVEMIKGAEREFVEVAARKEAARWLEGKNIVRVVFVKDRLINFVVAG
jgi:leucyl-tRNA synthetase